MHPGVALVALVRSNGHNGRRAGVRVAHRDAGSGYGCYWVVTREGAHEHTGPSAQGYTSVRLVGPDGGLAIPGSDAEVAVAALLG